MAAVVIEELRPAAQVGADRHVGAQANAHRVEQQRAHLVGEARFFGGRYRPILGRVGILEAPVLPRRDALARWPSRTCAGGSSAMSLNGVRGASGNQNVNI